MIVDFFVYEDLNSNTSIVWKNFFNTHLPHWDFRLCFANDILRKDAQHVFFPGGRGAATYKKLGEENSKRVIDWVKNGGSYIGVCAGAYLAVNHLKISPLTIPDKAWRRGEHIVDIKIKGEKHAVNYNCGPIFENYSDVEVWGTFKSNYIAKNGYLPMINTPAITHNTYGKGVVTLFSPHLEKSSMQSQKKLASMFKYIHNKIYNLDETTEIR